MNAPRPARRKIRTTRRVRITVGADAPLLKVLTTGGGLDSWVMLLDAAERGELPDLVIFADVTDAARLDPGEWPGTYAHLRDVVIPFCDRHGIAFKWLTTEESPIRGERSLFRYMELLRLIPSRTMRMCTVAAKVERVCDYLDATYPTHRLEVWVGFEAGEEDRAQRDPHSKGRAKGRRTNRFPLMERGICRCRAGAIAKASGLPVPPGSACMFCPFGSRGDFQTVAREEPAHFARFVQLEANCRTTKQRGRTVRFAGTEKAPTLDQWIIDKPARGGRGVRAYRRMGKGCAVCGAEVKAPKLVGCNPSPPARPKAQRSLPLFGGGA